MGVAGLSLVTLLALSACSKEDNGTGGENADGRQICFTAGTARNGWTPTKGTATRMAADPETETVAMEGSPDGRTVYLTTEVTDGFPGDDMPATRGTIVTDDNKAAQMEAFSVLAYMYTDDAENSSIYMNDVKVTMDATGNTWSPGTDYLWPNGKRLDFFAWYPHAAEGLTISGIADRQFDAGYTVPDEVSKQVDLMFACNESGLSGAESVPLSFGHALAAVRFVAGDDMPECTVKSVTLKNIYGTGKTVPFEPILTWVTLDSGLRDFTLSMDRQMDGTPDAPVTAEDQTFFMIPQDLHADALIEVVVNNGVSDFVLTASIGNGTWRAGKTYTYRISHDFDDLTVSNEEFIAYTDCDFSDQVAFYVKASPSSTTKTWAIAQTDGSGTGSETITVSPSTFSSDGSIIPVKISWKSNRVPLGEASDDDPLTATLIIYPANTADPAVKTIRLTRQNPDKDGAFWLYSVPETTSLPLGNDVLSLQNASESDWIGMTSSATYDSGCSRLQLDNLSGNGIYLQTLGMTGSDRFASLLATRESGNVMYCVQQKAVTADFGFKGCGRNISRESEKWNITLQGGRFKADRTAVEAKVVISSSVPDSQINSYGRDLTYGDPVTVNIDRDGTDGTAAGVSAEKYVKKRWDTQANNTANNGSRAVNVQVRDANTQVWYDVAGTGTMADWMTWTSHLVFGNGLPGGSNSWEMVKQIYTTYFRVHKDHPFFGQHKWITCWDNSYTNTQTNPSYYIYSCVRSINGLGGNSIHGISIPSNWGELVILQIYQYDPADPNLNAIYSQGGNNQCIFLAFQYSWRTAAWKSWNNTHVALALKNVSRPSDTNPITGSSVNE